MDLTFSKRFAITERFKLQFAGKAINVLNHPQYVGGYLSDVAPIGFTSTPVHNFLIPGTSFFMQPAEVFSSNPRQIQLSAKFIF